jgi:hypothetical protein
MADPKVNIAALTKLVDALIDLHEKQLRALDEMRLIIGGHAGIGKSLKRVYEAFDEAWTARYARTGGRRFAYVWNMREDTPAAKRLLAKLEPEEVIARVDRYLRSPNPFYAEVRHSFRIFARDVNVFADDLQIPFEDPGATVADCRHDPPCRSDQEHTRVRAREMRA